MNIAIIYKYHLLRTRSANQSQTLCGGSLRRGNENLYGQGHKTKMAVMAINSKNIHKASSPEPEGL